MPPSHRKPTKAEKKTIIELARQGLDPSTIGKQLEVDGRSVAGVLQSAVKAGKLENFNRANPPSPEPPMPETPAQPSSAIPVPPPPPVPVAPAGWGHAPQPQPPQQVDGFVGWRPSSSQGGAFSSPGQTVRYTVERKTPPDGILGQHAAPFNELDLGQLYGEGVYKLYRYLPGKAVPEELEMKIGPSFGPSRFPKSASSERRPDRPGYSRPWERTWERGDREEEGEPRTYRPGGFRDDYRERAMVDFARHREAGGSESAAAEAIRQFGEINRQTIGQMENIRKAGPDSFLTQAFKEQQERWERQRDEDRRREDQRRQDEEDKWERRQKEDREAWDRRQADDEKRHQRELDRIKAESEVRAREAATASKEREEREQVNRKYMLDLEEKRLALIREEAKLNQQRIENELKVAREEMKAVQAKTEAEIKAMRDLTQKELEDSREAVGEELKRQEAALDREHKLKEKALDKEMELEGKILEIKKEALGKEGGDQIFNMLNTVVKEFSKGLEKIVDLKKIEALSPEAQAAAVARGGSLDGNVLAAPKPKEEAAGGAQLPTAVMARSVPTNGNGAGATHAQTEDGTAVHAETASVEQKTPEERMDAIVQDMLRKPFFRSVIQEWALHVGSGSDATTFANMYLEWMRDPSDDEGRKACAAFATYMKPRNWALMFKVLKPHLDPETAKTFESEAAEEFYESFRAMVTEQIKDYWEQFLAAKQAQSQQKKAGAQSAPAPDKGESREDPGVPVPTREALRRQQ